MRAAARTLGGDPPSAGGRTDNCPPFFVGTFFQDIFSGHGIEIFQCYTLVSTHTRVAFSALRAASPRCAHKMSRMRRRVRTGFQCAATCRELPPPLGNVLYNKRRCEWSDQNTSWRHFSSVDVAPRKRSRTFWYRIDSKENKAATIGGHVVFGMAFRRQRGGA
jgi:hypothetical protein